MVATAGAVPIFPPTMHADVLVQLIVEGCVKLAGAGTADQVVAAVPSQRERTGPESLKPRAKQLVDDGHETAIKSAAAGEEEAHHDLPESIVSTILPIPAPPPTPRQVVDVGHDNPVT